MLADEHGNAIYLGKHNCSMQRRHQKVIEEAPAPGISRELIHKIGMRCVEACKAIGYRGAGTFKFLYKNSEWAAGVQAWAARGRRRGRASSVLAQAASARAWALMPRSWAMWWAIQGS